MENLSENLKAEIIAYIEKHQPEVYWDYREELGKEQIEKIISSKEGLLEVENELWDCNLEHICGLERDAVTEVLEYFAQQIEAELGEQTEWEDDFKDWARDLISVDLDIKQLIKNTGDEIFFYDTGLEFDGWGQSAAAYRLDRIIIKKALSITNSIHDSAIDMMLQQASYGGQLVVYFTSGIDDLLDISDDMNVVIFKNAHIAIINTGNGSGDNCQINGHEFQLPFDRDNLKFERSISYNYTYDVCGMFSNWCDDTCFSFKHDEIAIEAPKSSLNAILERDRIYEATFKAGKCTPCDMKYTRHRNVIYINNYPCGNKCLDCGTFWID
jgi:hypothetical protein